MTGRRAAAGQVGPRKESSDMLISQRGGGEWVRGNGCVRANLAELRRQLAEPSRMSDGSRQRLLELARRLARVQAMGDEYVRVGLSDYAAEALRCCDATA